MTDLTVYTAIEHEDDGLKVSFSVLVTDEGYEMPSIKGVIETEEVIYADDPNFLISIATGHEEFEEPFTEICKDILQEAIKRKML